MNLVPKTFGWLEKTSDWTNAILVKETRQSLKSRQFVITFLLLLVGAWLVSAVFVMENAERIDSMGVGGDFFNAFFFVLLVAIFIVVPFTAFRSLLAEREQNTFDVLAITALSPGQIVRGKMLSAFLQMFLYYSAITPFIAFASLLQGFDPAQSAYLLILAALTSLGCAMLGLMLGTLTLQRHYQVGLSLLLLGGLTILLFSFYGIAVNPFAASPFDDPDFWWEMAILFTVWASYFVLFYQIAVSRLTFESDNRSTGIRITCAAQFWLLWVGALFMAYVTGMPLSSWSLSPLIWLSGIHWLVVGLFAASEKQRLSRRTRHRLPKSPLLRFLLVPLLPGGNRGYLYILLHAVALVLVTATWPGLGLGGGASPLYPTGMTADSNILLATAAAGYLVIYAGIANLLSRVGPRLWQGFSVAYARITTLLLFLGGILFPLFVRIGGTFRYDANLWVDVTNPYTILEAISDHEELGAEVYVILAIVAGLVLLLNLSGIGRGIAEVFAPETDYVQPEPILTVVPEVDDSPPVPSAKPGDIAT